MITIRSSNLESQHQTYTGAHSPIPMYRVGAENYPRLSHSHLSWPRRSWIDITQLMLVSFRYSFYYKFRISFSTLQISYLILYSVFSFDHSTIFSNVSLLSCPSNVVKKFTCPLLLWFSCVSSHSSMSSFYDRFL